MLGYLSVGCCQLVDNNRVARYALDGLRASRLVPCFSPGLESVLEDAGLPTVYSTPGDDGVWWWSEAWPESDRFAGITIDNVAGLGAMPLLDQGDSTGVCPVMEPVTIRFEGTAWGADCCAVDYGLRAFREQLMSPCSCGCGTDGCMSFPICNPNAGTSPSVPGDARRGSRTPWRETYGATLTAGVEILTGDGRVCGGCGCWPMTRIAWEVTVRPGLWLPEVELVSGVPIFAADSCDLTDLSDCGQDCPDVTGPVTDPDCGSLPPAPPLPSPAPECVCPPLFGSRVSGVLDVPDTPFGVALVAKLSAGGTAARNVRIRVWPEIAGEPPGSPVYTACTPCVGVLFGYQAANTVRVWDGVTGTVSDRSVTGGPPRNAEGQKYLDVSGASRSLSGFGCGRYVWTVDIGSGNAAANAALSWSMVERQP